MAADAEAVTTRIASLIACGALLMAPVSSAAQDLVITNARIVAGNGTVVDRGTIVVRNGQIESVGAAGPAARGLRTIDAGGMTAMPGFIDAHRHVNTGPEEKAQMQALLEAGYTTVLSGGGPADGNITLRDRIDKGEINGPRIIPSGRIALASNTPEGARAEVRRLAQLGVKFTGEIALTPVPGPTPQELEVLKAIVDEGAKTGIAVQVHAVSATAMMAAIDAGVRLLVHVPNKDWVSRANATKLAASGTKILATIGFGAPIFGVFANDNAPRFRDGRPWPQSIVDGVRVDGEVIGVEAGYTAVNSRTIWDANGVLGYCTDSTYAPLAGLEHELRTYNAMFSMTDIIKLMGPNTASYLGMADQLGTLETGKRADIVLLDGNPLDGYWNMLRTRVVVKGGSVVVDKR
jgi:imidazolonepropionase-like amidohydrolase